MVPVTCSPESKSWPASKMSIENITPPQPSGDALYAAVENYPWATDTDFQAGLVAILGPTSDPPSSPGQTAELTLRARCFYYSRRHNTPLDFDAYKAWRASNLASSPAVPYSNPTSDSTSSPSSNTAASGPSSVAARSQPALPSSSSVLHSPETPAAPYPTSFSAIVELITKGEPVPGVREIPGTVLEGEASTSKARRRKKPWEQEEGEEEGATSTKLGAAEEGAGMRETT